jgi:hypothetical protein
MFLSQIDPTFLFIVAIMFRINGNLYGPIGYRTPARGQMLAAVMRIIPPRIDVISSALHLLNNATMIRHQIAKGMSENILNRAVRFSPSSSAQGTAFAVLS